ncbi:MAG: type II toxin-antitoxin system ParD family antitoxin [Theionarchaea archaeon]|nr:type II toxin-antitoxin system ParD family antitoxin [Theionarchaea archaeon]
MEKKVFKTSVALDEDMINFIDKMIEKKRFASRSHAVNFALQLLKEKYEEEEIV